MVSIILGRNGASQALPTACSVAAESKQFPEEVRCMLFGTTRGRTYRALFVVRGDIVHILCVRGPGEKAVKPQDVDL